MDLRAVLRHRPLLVAIGGGVVFALSAPPTDLYPAVLLGLGALFLAVEAAPRLRTAAWLGAVWATSAGLVGMRFIPSVIVRFTELGTAGGVAALVLLAAGQSGSWALGMVAARALRRFTGLDARLAFGTGVVLSIAFVLVIAWTPAGLVSPWPVLIQLADVIGERGVSFLLAVAAALLATPLLPWIAPSSERYRRPWVAPALGAGLLSVMAVHGAVRMREVRRATDALPTLKIGVVQAAVDARLRWEPAARELIHARLLALTARSEGEGAELTIWPEAAYPFVLSHAEGPTPRGPRAIVGRRASAVVHGPVLLGAITADRDGNRMNSSTLVGRDGRMQLPQAKLELLWFGETVPLGEHLPFLRKAFSRAGGLIPGTQIALQNLGAARIGVLNCYEDTLPGIGRRIAKREPNLLVNVTNDAWFGPTAEPELHLRLSALRAVETRRDLVRAVNLGVPAWIDAAGTVRARGSANVQGVLHVTPALNDAPATFYVRAGDAPWILGLVLAIGDALVRRRRRDAKR